MRLAACATILPNRLVTNRDICSLVEQYSPEVTGTALTKLWGSLERYLEGLGANTRHWLAANEKPIHLIHQACLIASERAQIELETIDNLIYCGVDRPLLEPASAALVAFELGLEKIRAFDISHACLGWFTSLQIAGDRADARGETSLIVSAEFPMTHGGAAFPRNFRLSNRKRDREKLATFVLGEATSATIVCPGGSSLKFEQRNDNTGFDASYVRLPRSERFLSKLPNAFAANEELTFVSNSDELTKHGMRIGFEVFDALNIKEWDEIAIIPHTVSSKLLNFLQEHYQQSLKIVNLFPEVGNIGTCSLPAGWLRFTQTADERRKKPERLIGWMVAAGMTAVAFEFPSHGALP